MSFANLNRIESLAADWENRTFEMWSPLIAEEASEVLANFLADEHDRAH